MSPRKNIKGVALGLLGTFVSRNNDIDGYWDIGVLRLYSEKHHLSTLTFDLLNSLNSLESKSPISVTEVKYQSWLRKALENRKSYRAK
jgi:hypothetical protein